MMAAAAVLPDRFLERAHAWVARYQVLRTSYRAAVAKAEALRPPVGTTLPYLQACRGEDAAWRRFDAVAAEVEELLHEARGQGSRAYMQVCRLILRATERP